MRPYNTSRPIIFILAVCFFTIVNAQSQEILKEINFSGLKRMQPSYLRLHLQLNIGHIISDSLIIEDVQRLKNIVGIGNVTYSLTPRTGGGQSITYHIQEIQTLLPILNFGGIEGNVWFRVGFTDINWRGKGQHFSAAYQNSDGRHSGNIYFKVPKIKGSPWGFSISASRWASTEPLFFPDETIHYNYTNDGIGLSIIHHFDFFRNVEFGGTYFVETYNRLSNPIFDRTQAPANLQQPKWLAKVSYSEYFINHHLFYLDGISWNALSQSVFNTLDQSWFHSFQLLFKHYKRIGKKGNLAQRARFGIATNNDSPFAPFVADSHVNIRGIGNRIDRGTAQIILNTEYRHTVTESKRWGSQFVAFSDAGTWRNPGGELKDLFKPEQFRLFMGLGVRLIYHKIYDAVLRIDYGIDLFNKEQRGFVIGLGQYF